MPKFRSFVEFDWDADSFADVHEFDTKLQEKVQSIADELGIEYGYELKLRRDRPAKTEEGTPAAAQQIAQTNGSKAPAPKAAPPAPAPQPAPAQTNANRRRVRGK